MWSKKKKKKERERFQINNLTLCLKELEKQELTKLKVTNRKEITKVRAEIETRKTIEKINETKSWFSEKKNKIDKPLAGLREKPQINAIRNDVPPLSLLLQANAFTPAAIKHSKIGRASCRERV